MEDSLEIVLRNKDLRILKKPCVFAGVLGHIVMSNGGTENDVKIKFNEKESLAEYEVNYVINGKIYPGKLALKLFDFTSIVSYKGEIRNRLEWTITLYETKAGIRVLWNVIPKKEGLLSKPSEEELNLIPHMVNNHLKMFLA